MYLEHFGLEQHPFTITPDTEFFLDHGSHNEALNVLRFALHSGEGFIKVTGEVGTGKTLLCRKLLNSLSQDFITAYIPNPFLNPVALRMALAGELGIEFARNIGQPRLLELINARLMQLHADDRQVVLLLDEAQALPDESMEALRLLSNLETEKTKLLQVVLFGQPELDVRLRQEHLRQLRQRILFSYRLRPLAPAELAVYLQHRLLVAGYRGAPLFTPRALKQLQRSSRGVPRLINILAHKAMLCAFGRGEHCIDRFHIRKAAGDTDDIRPRRHRLALASSLFGLLTLTSAGFYAAWH
ncbi:MAG: AAA family ATPase [Gammaproteobacteria bacterium]|jgi:MSHA biogenesis protein MshM